MRTVLKGWFTWARCRPDDPERLRDLSSCLPYADIVVATSSSADMLRVGSECGSEMRTGGAERQFAEGRRVVSRFGLAAARRLFRTPVDGAPIAEEVAIDGRGLNHNSGGRCIQADVRPSAMPEVA